MFILNTRPLDITHTLPQDADIASNQNIHLKNLAVWLDKFHSRLLWRVFFFCSASTTISLSSAHLNAGEPTGSNRAEPVVPLPNHHHHKGGGKAQRETHSSWWTSRSSAADKTLSAARPASPLPFPSCSQHEHPPQTLHCGTAFFLLFFLHSVPT